MKLSTFLSSFVYLFAVNVHLALAQSASVNDNPGNPGTVNNNTGNNTVELQNPLGNQTLIGFFQDLLDAVMVLAVPVIVFFIILAGFKYVTARGNVTQIEQAHKALLYAIIGGVLILGAQALLIIIQSTVGEFGSGTS